MLCDLCPNVYLDTSSSNSWMRYEEAHLDLRTIFRRALDVAGPRRLLFGTDSSYFPRGWHVQVFETQSKALYEIGVEVETARLIFHDNLVAFVFLRRSPISLALSSRYHDGPFRFRRPSQGRTLHSSDDPAPRTAILAPGFREITHWCAFSPKAGTSVPGDSSPDSSRRPAGIAAKHWRVRLGLARPSGDRLHLRRRAGLSPPRSRIALAGLRRSGLRAVSRPEEPAARHRVRRALGPARRFAAASGLPLEHEACACGNPAPRADRAASRIEELAELLA